MSLGEPQLMPEIAIGRCSLLLGLVTPFDLCPDRQINKLIKKLKNLPRGP